MAKGYNSDEKEKHANDKIYQLTFWHDDVEKRKLFSIERFDNVLQVGVKKYSAETGGYDFKYDVSVAIKWDNRAALLKHIRNMLKNAKVEKPEDNQKLYDASITTPTGTLTFNVKKDASGDIVAGFTMETEKGNGFFVLPTFIIDENIKTYVAADTEIMSGTVTVLETIVETLQAYCYDFTARTAFFTKKYSDRKSSYSNTSKDMNSSDEFPF